MKITVKESHEMKQRLHYPVHEKIEHGLPCSTRRTSCFVARRGATKDIRGQLITFRWYWHLSSMFCLLKNWVKISIIHFIWWIELVLLKIMGPFIFILRILLSLVEGVIKRLILALAYNLQSNVMLTVARAQLHEVQKKNKLLPHRNTGQTLETVLPQ
jgi:hypothetical protein